MKRVIFLLGIGEPDKAVLRKLKKNLNWFFKPFGLSVKLFEQGLSLTEKEYIFVKKQYNASLVIGRIIKFIHYKKFYRTLGIMDFDMYSGVKDYVFGVAKTPPKKSSGYFSGVALISLTRLREAFYRREVDPALFELRVLKEAIHELGHTFGLMHCEGNCIMKSSRVITDTDNKPPNYCERCKADVKEFLKDS